jgi:hypothetical protein
MTARAMWMAMFAGPVAWAFNQGVGYAVVKPLCARQEVQVLWLVAVAAFAAAAAGAWGTWSSARQLRGAAVDDGGRAEDRSYFLAIVGTALNILLGLLIVTTLMAQLSLNSCE